MHVSVAVSLSICSMEAMILQYLPRQHACKVNNFCNDRGLCRCELTNLNLFCYFIFLSRIPVFVASERPVLCSIVSREKRIGVLRAIIL